MQHTPVGIIVALTVAVLFVTCRTTSVGPAPEQPRHVFSVCEIAANSFDFAGKRVAVRGTYYQGLLQDNCPKSLVVKGRVWPTAIFLTGTNESQNYSRVSFRTNYRSWDALDAQLIKVARERGTASLKVTAEGLLLGLSRTAKTGEIVGGVWGTGCKSGGLNRRGLLWN